jgi:hypothetical protein
VGENKANIFRLNEETNLSNLVERIRRQKEKDNFRAKGVPPDILLISVLDCKNLVYLMKDFTQSGNE